MPEIQGYNIDAARRDGVPENAILEELKRRGPAVYKYDDALKDGVPISDINTEVARRLNSNPEFKKQEFRKKLLEPYSKDNVIEGLRPIVDSLAVTGGGTLGSVLGPVGSIAGGISAGIGADSIMQHLQSADFQAKNRSTLAGVLGTDKGGTGETVANAVQNVGLNELMGKIFNSVQGGFKKTAGPVIDPKLASLEPTYSQYDGNPKSFLSRIEGIWNATGKNAAIENSTNLAKDQFGKLQSKVSGRNFNIPGINTNDVLAKDIQNIGKMSIENINDRISGGRSDVESVGKLNSIPEQIIPAQTIPGAKRPSVVVKNVDKFGNNQIMDMGYHPPTVVPESKIPGIEGPIQFTNTVAEAQKLLAEKQKISQTGEFKGFTDDDKKLIATANEIIENTKNGTRPVPVESALDLLHGDGKAQGLQDLSQKAVGEISNTKDATGRFADALHKDIESSIQNWNDPGKKALNGFYEANASRNFKKTLFEGGNLQNLIQTQNSPIPQIESALKDPIQTQRLLNASQMNGIKSQNMRQDLAGYRLNQIWQKADNGAGGINGDTLLKEWNNPDYQATKNKLYSASTQKEIGEFFNNVSKVTDSGQNTSGYKMFRMTLHGVNLGASLVSGIVSGHAIGAGVGGFAAIEIPMLALSRILSNPSKAQILQKLVKGAPLDMSEQQAGRLIMSGLNGITVGILGNDGKSTSAEVKDGKIQ